MGQDLRELFAKEREERGYVMKKGHEARFLEKLEEEMPNASAGKKTSPSLWLGIAASVVLVFGLGIYFLSTSMKADPAIDTVVVENETSQKNGSAISLGDLSPDLKKIESYYVTNINLELSGLEFTGDNKDVIDGYMERLAELDKEYGRLNADLNEFGPNDQTIEALIKNLQLRLQLLQKLKSKLNQLKSSKNEHESSHII
ncbi:MAG: hypothetical protein ABJN84_13105 [Flavobacteriaceae bacterium]